MAKPSIPSKAKSRASKKLMLSEIIGARPVLPGEDSVAFDSLQKCAYDTFAPANIIEEIYVRNFTDLTWEAERYRRDRDNFINANLYWGLVDLLRPLCDFERAESLAMGWTVGSADEIQVVEKILSKAGLSVEHIRAQTIALRINDIERISQLIFIAETRREAVLRELMKFRAAFSAPQPDQTMRNAEIVELNGRRLLQSNG